MKRSAIALAALMTVAHAQAMEPMIAELAKVDRLVEGVAPTFACYDQTDPETCQQLRVKARFIGGAFARYSTRDFADKAKTHHRCFQPDSQKAYQVCSGAGDIWGEVTMDDRWVHAPLSDARCHRWGGPLTVEYLACEAALPPKQD
jgi:hypothetical protein